MYDQMVSKTEDGASWQEAAIKQRLLLHLPTFSMDQRRRPSKDFQDSWAEQKHEIVFQIQTLHPRIAAQLLGTPDDSSECKAFPPSQAAKSQR